MRVTWLISGQVQGDAPSEWNSPLASIRYRVLAPSRHLHAEGHRPAWIPLQRCAEDDPTIGAHLAADVVVVSKVLSNGSLQAAARAQDAGAKLVVDLCDDHFDTPELAAAYRGLCDMADLVVASTTAMAATIRHRTGRTAVVIDDPYEGPLGDPLFYPGMLVSELRLVWFGHPVNFDTVAAMMPGLREQARTTPLELHLVTDLEAARRSPLFADLQNSANESLKLRLTAWSPAATWQGLAQCDAVLLPSLPTDKKKVKSPNRAVEGIRAGRLVLAYPLPAYQELNEGLWLGEDLCGGIPWALRHPHDALARIRAGQLSIARRFSPGTIGRRWEAVLMQLAECGNRTLVGVG